jgi:hypothetical protein
MKNILIVVEKIKTHILCSITFFENRAVYEIMLKNTVEPNRHEEHVILFITVCVCIFLS